LGSSCSTSIPLVPLPVAVTLFKTGFRQTMPAPPLPEAIVMPFCELAESIVTVLCETVRSSVPARSVWAEMPVP
jgi:hypothetical protein